MKNMYLKVLVTSGLVFFINMFSPDKLYRTFGMAQFIVIALSGLLVSTRVIYIKSEYDNKGYERQSIVLDKSLIGIAFIVVEIMLVLVGFVILFEVTKQ